MSTHAECEGRHCGECWEEGYDKGYETCLAKMETLREKYNKELSRYQERDEKTIRRLEVCGWRIGRALCGGPTKSPCILCRVPIYKGDKMLARLDCSDLIHYNCVSNLLS